MRPVPQIALQTAREYQFRARVHGDDTLALHGDCLAPKHLELRGVGSLQLTRLAQLKADPFVDWYDDGGALRFVPGRGAADPPRTQTVFISVRCRKCVKCLDHKRRQWTARAINEVRLAARTWFGTLTVAPEYRFRAKLLAERKAIRGGHRGLSDLSDADRTKALASELAPEVTLWLKRVRKESKTRFRYLLVSEPHEDGFPHFHLLLHEREQPVRKRVLEQQWKLGFSQWKLLDARDARAVGYVCKYINKSTETRVRASQTYGRTDISSITERVAATLQTLAGAGTTSLSKDVHKRGTSVAREGCPNVSVKGSLTSGVENNGTCSPTSRC